MTAPARAELLRALTDPASVAIVGASDNPAKLQARPMDFLRRHGFRGAVHPVNPGRETVAGARAYPLVSAIPEPVDHAYLLVGAEAAESALSDCASAGVKVVSLLADGFAEAGPEGRARQDRLAALAAEAGILLIGPNSTGVVATHSGFSCTTNAAFRLDALRRGRLAVLSQSGSLIGTLLSRGEARGRGFSTLISVGNEAGAGVGQLGSLLLDDPHTDAFLLFLETIRDREALAEFARAAHAQGKPVVAYMIGASEEGQALSVSHTGALTGSSAACAALLRGLGIRQAEQFETLLDAPPALARARLPAARPRQVTVVSTTGGGGAMLIDQMAARGARIAGPGDAARAKLQAQAIPMGHGKLVDVTLAGTNYATMKEVVSTLAADPETGLLLVCIGSSAQFQPDLAVKPIVDAVAEAPEGAAPVIAFPLPEATDALAMLEAGGVPTFRSVEVCAETAAMLLAPCAPAPVPDGPLPPRAAALLDRAPAGVMDELDAGEVFAALGAPRPRQALFDLDLPIVDPGLGWPVVAKLVSADLPHKTEAGAIRVGVPDLPALRTAAAEMRAAARAHAPGARLRGLLAQEMRRGLGEAIVGVSRDPLAGPVVTVGQGGVLTEIYRDAAVRPAPVTVEIAREMLAEVRGFALLRGFRGAPAGDLEALARLVADVSRIALHPRVEEAEINPVLVGTDGVVLLDALVRLG
ncbi:acetate--CoA ligase family protein [Albimonas sp. CAU 1670]|uniref:acetate--CoA ligase family protein n=1 Tax=Albimonas sp. CAU 1670 TaxID=3032599 RepID=UPI0023DC7A72|nr:acetate--CoA ligase [Albimonas sp. CAU 1670]MDF2233743.1 acetate--CoA ligase family protein [Albimonas sp. CAU 1670]